MAFTRGKENFLKLTMKRKPLGIMHSRPVTERPFNHNFSLPIGEGYVSPVRAFSKSYQHILQELIVAS